MQKEQICEWCGKEFSAAAVGKRFCEGEHFKNCDVCAGEFLVSDPYNPRRTCSNKCNGVLVNSEASKAKRRETSRKKWGTDYPQQSEEVKEKIAEANLEKFGYSTPLASPDLRAKGRETSLKKYGVEYYTQSNEGKAARARTNLERYGAENTFSSAEIQDKIKKIWLKKYGVEHPMKNKGVVKKGQQTNMQRYGVPNVLMVPEFREKALATFSENVNKRNIKHRKVSKINQDLANKIQKELGASILFERALGKFSIDLYLEKVDVFVDVNPTISHNVSMAFGCVIGACPQPCAKHSPIAKEYHFKRAQEALSRDKIYIQHYGWDSGEALLKMLSAKVSPIDEKYSARKLTVSKISPREANDFFGKHHVQGGVKAQTHCYALYNGDDLVAAASFGKSRFGAKEEWEWLRYAVKSGVIVRGASGKLFKEFCKEVSPSSVISYVDFSHTTKKNIFLNSCGFLEDKATGPSLVWHRFLDNKAVRDTSLLALGADRILKTNYGSREDSGLSNGDIMLLEGFLPVYTAGNRVFKWFSK